MSDNYVCMSKHMNYIMVELNIVTILFNNIYKY